jgi:hypothetical protein
VESVRQIGYRAEKRARRVAPAAVPEIIGPAAGTQFSSFRARIMKRLVTITDSAKNETVYKFKLTKKK